TAHRDGDRVSGLTFRNLATGGLVDIDAALVVDATETGELLDLAGVEHVIGAESAAETGELHALPVAEPMAQQALTWCFAMDHLPGEDHTIARPARYS
ncbi:FAD-dependent oxidoreductase, partial [Escherichia coli]|uniref:FAD-dependent oxidoreductase n=1 Tax=Escherichia coli TaxID=562 RepID=UPI0013D7CF2A